MNKICGNCLYYRHPAGGPMCNVTKKSVGFLQAACGSYEESRQNTIQSNNKMEPKTKVCKECGRELPIEKFDRQSKSKDGHMHICHECMKAKKAAGRAPKAAETPAPAKVVVYQGIERYEDAEIIEELRRRGYTGELVISKTITL